MPDVLILHIFIACCNAAIGTYVLWQNPKSPVHRLFFIFVFGAVGWGLGLALLVMTKSFIFATLTLWSAEVIVMGLVLFAEKFPVPREHSIKRFYLFTPWLLLAALTPSKLFIRAVSFNARGYVVPQNGPLFPLFAIVMAVYLALSFYYFARSFRESRGIRREQMRYFLVGIATFIGSGFLFDAILPAFGIFSFNLIGPLCSIVFVGCTAYAIIRYQFLDIDVVIKRSITYVVTLFAVAIVFFCVEFAIEKFYSNDEVVDIIAAMAGALAFARFRDFFEKITDRIFFRADYNYGDAIRNLGPALSATIELRGLLGRIDAFLAKTIKPSRLIFFLADSGVWLEYDHANTAPANISMRELPEEAVRRYSLSFAGIALHAAKATLMQDPEFLNGTPKIDDATAIVPFLSASARIAAVMFVGEKLSGDILRPKDVGVLSVIAHQGGMAILNAQLYETIRKHNEELEVTVAERTKEIKELYHAQEAFVTDISHQLQTPIAILEGNLELAEKRPTEHAKSSLKVMRNTLDGMAQLVNDILEIARLNFSKNKFYKDRFDMGALVEEAYEDCCALTQTKGVRLLRFTEAVDIVGDRKKLKEVILNFLSNALKHTDSGGEIVMEVHRRNGTAEISVRDTGMGIPPENLPHIFERFYRIPGDVVHGNGLGLNICREIVELCGGTIHVESVVGEGSIFTVRIPFAPEADVVASGIL